jgi:hypothetical protein
MIILPVVLYGCENWFLTIREEYRLEAFENRVLMKIFGSQRGEMIGKLHSKELHNLFPSPNIIKTIKPRRIRWTGHALGRSTRRWEDNNGKVKRMGWCGLDSCG